MDEQAGRRCSPTAAGRVEFGAAYPCCLPCCCCICVLLSFEPRTACLTKLCTCSCGLSAGKDVVIVGVRRILPPAKHSRKAERPRTRTLTSVSAAGR